MCGIIGVFNNKDSVKQVLGGLALLKNRGRDGYGISTTNYSRHSKYLTGLRIQSDDSCIGHSLHSVVGNVSQPLVNKAKLVANCEIYNWKELAVRYSLSARNDAEAILEIITKQGKEKIRKTLGQLDGDYAFCYWDDDEVILARDLIGVKPLFYSHSGSFAFASEKKVLERLGYTYIRELNPRKIIKYNVNNDSLQEIHRDFYKITPQNKDTKEKIKQDLKATLITAVKKRLPEQKLGILFSGGIDSSLLALICKSLHKDFTCYTAVLDEPSMSQADDLIYAERAAKELGFPLKVKKIRLRDAAEYLTKVVPLIEDTNVTKAGVGITFFPACELAKKDGIKVLFSGLGSEEIFGGYQRHKQARDINKECVSGLMKMYERDTYRDDVITMANSLELRVPYLDHALIDFALKIPGKYKIDNGKEKIILREVAQELGLNPLFAERKKKAAQYGSKMHRAIEKLTRSAGFKLKSEYLRQFYPNHNLRLGALSSGGKDSLYAMYIMMRQNYHVRCLISIISENPASYMFHTPAIDLVHLQAKALNIPLVQKRSKGEKEKELLDLKRALTEAKRRYRIEGVITGALYSTYQRDRIEKVAGSLGLKIFSPLWHINQETEMRDILDSSFNIIFVSVAAEGLDKTWLGRKITGSDLAELVKLDKKIGLNIAGEGGEFETLVLDMPYFTQKINIIKASTKMENECTGILEIGKAELSNEKKEKNPGRA